MTMSQVSTVLRCVDCHAPIIVNVSANQPLSCSLLEPTCGKCADQYLAAICLRAEVYRTSALRLV